MSIKTTCPYCGVGCGVVAERDDDGELKLRGDKEHPANLGRLCSKGAALGQTLTLDDRLLHPKIAGKRAAWDEAIATVASKFREAVDSYGPDAVAFYVSGQLLTEDYYVANKLMKGYIGAANIDTNSRLCMASTVAGYKRAFGSDTVPCSYEDLEQARLIVLVGSNTAWCHPVVYQRIQKAKNDNPDLKIVVIDPRRTASCDIADLHLPLKPGADALIFSGLLAFLERHGHANPIYVEHCTQNAAEALAAARTHTPDVETVAEMCGLKVDEIVRFYKLFAETERVVTVFSQGINQSSSGTDKVNAIINCHLYTGRIGRPGMGPFSLTGQPNAMGGREVGGMANQLAAHMDLGNSEHQNVVQSFWQSPTIASRAGLKAVDLFNAVADGKIKALWIMGTNPAVSMPDANRVRQALAICPFVVVSDCIEKTDTTAYAHVLLPALGWGEKDGTVTNSERRISRQAAFLPAPGEAKADWWIVTQVARAMGYSTDFPYEHPAHIFREYAALSGYENNGSRDFDISGLAQIDEAQYNRLQPLQWPVTAAQPYGTQRMFADGRFFTPERKARFIAITPRPPQNAVDQDYRWSLNTGRVRDQWHTMTRTGKAPRLADHSPEPYLEIHPRDAVEIAVKDGELGRVTSRYGENILRVRVSDAQQRGSVFAPMHWNDQFASHAAVDKLVNAVVDPVSGQPELKHTPVRVEAYRPAWYGFLLTRRQLALSGVTYWARAKGDGFYRYEIAGDQSPSAWPAWARQLLCAKDEAVNWVEYHDVKTQRYRGVRLVAGRIESCLFIAPQHDLPSRSWLASLFGRERLSDKERVAVLSGKPPQEQADVGRIVCACFSVGVNTLVEAITKQHLTTAETIGAALKAGTNCGSCVPELKALIRQTL